MDKLSAQIGVANEAITQLGDEKKQAQTDADTAIATLQDEIAQMRESVQNEKENCVVRPPSNTATESKQYHMP